MRKVYSTAFYRHNSSGYESERAGAARGIFFVNFIEPMIEAVRVAYPGWELWIHHDGRVMEFPVWSKVQRLHDTGLIKLIPMGDARTLCGSMLWRMRPCFDTSVDYVACRDVDSLPMDRDHKMLQEFISSGGDVHAILDSESHCGPLMGGMTAYSGTALRREFDSYENMMGKGKEIDWNIHGADQRFLNTYVFPRFFRKTFIHQKRRDVQYPNAMQTRQVAPKETPLDNVVNHIGAAYSVERAKEVLAGMKA
jgi:hypothetical protein